MDITEAFESHHLSPTPEKLLSQFFVRKASKPRNSPFTFEDDGFYRTLKRRIEEALKEVSESTSHSKIITDFLFISYIALAVSTVVYKSFSLAILAGLALSCCAIASHNFFHQRDNFRMYYFDFSMMSSQ